MIFECVRRLFAAMLASLVLATVAVSPSAAEFWDQQACIAEGNTDDVCNCTRKLIDDSLAAKFKADVIAAFDEKGLPGVEQMLPLEQQMALAGMLIDVMTVKAPDTCKYKDNPSIN